MAAATHTSTSTEKSSAALTDVAACCGRLRRLCAEAFAPSAELTIEKELRGLLSARPITVDILKQTGIAKVVKPLRKHQSGVLAELAVALFTQWKVLAKTELRNMRHAQQAGAAIAAAVAGAWHPPAALDEVLQHLALVVVWERDCATAALQTRRRVGMCTASATHDCPRDPPRRSSPAPSCSAPPRAFPRGRRLLLCAACAPRRRAACGAAPVLQVQPTLPGRPQTSTALDGGRLRTKCVCMSEHVCM